MLRLSRGGYSDGTEAAVDSDAAVRTPSPEHRDGTVTVTVGLNSKSGPPGKLLQVDDFKLIIICNYSAYFKPL